MRTISQLTIVVISSLMVSAAASAADIGTGFSYQGRLENPPGTPVNDTWSFRFGLWDAAALGNEIGTSPVTVAGVVVANGLFTVAATGLDFGVGAIDGTARWLEIEVQ